MNITFNLPYNFHNSLISGAFDFDAVDRCKMYLMRDGFSFLSTSMGYKKNFQAATSSIALVLDAATSGKTATITHADAGNYYTTLGFVVGNYVTTNNASNDGVYRVTAVSDTTLQISWVSGDGLVDASFTGTVSCVDEHATEDTYTIGTGVTIDFDVSGNDIIMDSVDLTTAGVFGTAISTSPGFMIVDNNSPYPIVAYALFSDLVLRY